MLPPFDEFGYLPRGIHPASVEEIISRFGHGSPEREVEARELADLVDWARKNHVGRLIVNGSFVTDKQVPNDIDVVLLPCQDERQQKPMFEAEQVWPFIQILIAADEADLKCWAADDFGTDRNGRPKGGYYGSEIEPTGL